MKDYCEILFHLKMYCNIIEPANKDNVGSAKSIRNNGGALENEIIVDGVVEQRYWIELAG